MKKTEALSIFLTAITVLLFALLFVANQIALTP